MGSGEDQLRRDLDEAVAAARAAEHELGRQRGINEELRVQLARARQDQAEFQSWIDRKRRAEATWRRVRDGVRRRWPSQ